MPTRMVCWLVRSSERWGQAEGRAGRNREHLAAWEPRRSAEFWTVDWWARQLEYNQREFREDRGARRAAPGL